MRRHAKIENMASMSIEELELYAERCSFINLPYVGDEITKRRAARDAILDLAEQLDAEGWVVVRRPAEVDNLDLAPPEYDSPQAFAWLSGWNACAQHTLAAAPLPASPSSVEG